MKLSLFTKVKKQLAIAGVVLVTAGIIWSVYTRTGEGQKVKNVVLISIGSALATRVGHAIGAGNKPGVNLAIGCGGSGR